jgi:signal transduction histidine kinase
MSSNLILKVRILGGLSAFLLIIMTLLILVFSIFNDKREETKNSIFIYKQLQNNKILSHKNFFMIENKEQIKAVKNSADFVLFDPIFRDAFYSGNIQLYKYNNFYYYQFFIENKIFWYKNSAPASNYIYFIMIALVAIAFLLFFLQSYITKALNDITSLQNSRTLFLRNIMHEFKTPLTRATLIVHTLQKELKQKEPLIKECEILSSHFDQLRLIETLRHDSSVKNKKPHALIDIIEEIEEFLESEHITHNISQEMINVDFENFFIALKNIIDNGLKYSLDGKVSIMIENDVLKISNKAHPLKMPFEHYLEPFERGQNNTTSGMGLGLYSQS